MDQEDICVWPCGTWCHGENLEEFLMSHSDDYRVIAWDSFEAAWITGALEDGCKALFNHEFWQVLNDSNIAALKAFLGVRHD